MGILLGSVNVFFRDVGQFLNVILQFWFWFTPIVYPVTILPGPARKLMVFNPLAPLVEAYQNIIIYHQWPQWSHFGWHVFGVILVLWLGFFVFNRLSGEMVDEL